jgi:hypothetical protein
VSGELTAERENDGRRAGERVLELSARRDWVFGGIGSSSVGKSGKNEK